MSRTLSFLIACTLALAAPWLRWESSRTTPSDSFPGWPAELDGRPLVERELGDREARFAARFPGRVLRCSDGSREWILRWVERPTRRLHAAADCFRGLGFEITPQPLERDTHGRLWGVSLATKDGERLIVRERIVGPTGESWTDTSSWWWAAAMGDSPGPWWAYTSVER